MFRVLSAILVAFVLCGATPAPAGVEEARAAFKALPLQERLDIQSLLTVNGYWSAVANDTFGAKLMEAIQSFQSDNGFAETGILPPDQRQVLREKASPLLREWGLAPVRHPSVPATLWVPKGLDLSTKKDDGDLEFEAKSEALLINFISVTDADPDAAYKIVRADLLKGRTMRIEYEVLKRDFFVISASGDGVSAYTRFQQQGSGIVGFMMFWGSDSPVKAERLVVLMSDLFRTSVGQKSSRQPPLPVDTKQSSDERFIVIASRTELEDAITEARAHHARLSELSDAAGMGPNFDSLFVAQSSNGRYAVVIGPIAASKVAETRDAFRSDGFIPDDSFIADGSKLLDVVWSAPKEAAVAAPSRTPSKPKSKAGAKDAEGNGAEGKGADDDEEEIISTGTGFYVTPRAILTNAHVVEGCTNVTTSLKRGPVVGKVIARDEENDLALIRAGEEGPKTAAFRGTAQLGEDIAAFGFPLSDQLASSGNFTRGNVTATAGLHDDSRHLQFSAPIQPGNSGGPLLDEAGNVIGVIFSKLRDSRTADSSGDIDIHQNVNFAIRTAIATRFLESNGVTPQTVGAGTPLRPADLAAKAQGFTVAIRCQQ